MNVILSDEPKKKVELRCGDVVKLEGNMYLIVREDAGFIAKDFNGESGSTGHHITLEGLLSSFQFYNFTYYSQSEYELRLVKK